LWFIAAVILSSYAANEESKIANVLFIDFFVNKGSYGVASVNINIKIIFDIIIVKIYFKLRLSVL
jgi:hypothetical protein